MLEVNSYELINKCSPYILLNFIKIKCERKTTTPTNSTPATETTPNVVALRTAKATTRQTKADREEWSHRTSSYHTTESEGKSAIIMT